MVDENKKESVSVKEIEEFAKNHRLEVFFCLMFLLACIFGFVGVFRPSWNILLTMVGGVVGFIFPIKIEQMLKKTFHFVFKQDKTIQIVFGILGLVLTCVVPFAIFFILGIAGGRALHQITRDASSYEKQ